RSAHDHGSHQSHPAVCRVLDFRLASHHRRVSRDLVHPGVLALHGSDGTCADQHLHAVAGHDLSRRLFRRLISTGTSRCAAADRARVTIARMIAVEVRGLAKTYRGAFRGAEKVALRGVDLVIEKGVAFGLIGPNGAGKTTFIKALLGIVRPTQGSI